MIFFKFQIACFTIVLLLAIIYLIQVKKRELKFNHFFDAVLLNCLFFIFFDGLTSWSVNHQNIISHELNQLFHLFFFLTVNSTVFCAFLYMCNKTVGFPKKTFKRILIFLPFLVSLFVIIIFIKDLSFLNGKTTKYSMGISVYACFGTILFHFGMLLLIAIIHRHKIEKIKQIGIIFSLIFTYSLLIAQAVFPEALLSALAPVCLLLSFYMILENPATKKLEKNNQEMISSFSTLVEERDNSTGEHIRRTKEYVKIILDELQAENLHKKELTKDFIKNMLQSAPMHDIGKIATPDEILKAPRKLTQEEKEIMKKHAEKGGEIIKNTFANLNEKEFLQTAYLVARHHHERWNGKGYPDKLEKEQIPLCARIMAVADVFDAISANRCYRKAIPLKLCFEIIKKGRGSHFDPEIADAFLNAKEKVIKVYETKK